jgi:Ecdysteroid kinase-like family
MQEVEEKTPDWLNQVFLQKALRSYRRDDSIEVLNFTVNSGFSEHFASSMFQSKIVFKSSKYSKSEPETMNVVVKAKPFDNDMKMKVVSNGPLFETEIRMYKEVIPAFQQLFERSDMKVELGPE